MKGKCLDCKHLDKEKKMSYGKAYLYGCRLRETGYVSTWINTDATLSLISCNTDTFDEYEDEQEEVEIIKQMSLDEYLGG